MKSAGKARSNGLYRHIRTSKEIIRNLLNDYPEKSKQRKLFTCKGCVRRGKWAEQYLNRLILLFRYHQQAHSAIGRQLPCQPRPVFCHGIVAVAYAGVNRVLKHVIPILYQKVAKSSGFPPLLFCLDGQVKKYKHSHKSTHNRGAAMPAASAAPKRRPFPCRCAGFAPAVPWRKPRCGAVRRKECQRSSARTARA